MPLREPFRTPSCNSQRFALLLGDGYVGSRFAEYLKRWRIPFTTLRRNRLDYTVAGRLENYLHVSRPSFVINAAGFTGRPNVDACEDARANCLLGNAVLPGIIREACESAKIPWGHVSSGCIFTGKRPDGQGFTEDDQPNFTFRQDNCSFYSGSKALGEEALEGADQCFVWRLRIPFDNRDSSRNYLSKLMRYPRLLQAENSISHLDDFVVACLRCWLEQVPFGVYNVVQPGSINTSSVVHRLRAFGLIEREVEYFSSEDEFLRTAARAPRSNCILSPQKLIHAGIRIRSVDEALEDAISTWIPEGGSASPILRFAPTKPQSGIVAAPHRTKELTIDRR